MQYEADLAAHTALPLIVRAGFEMTSLQMKSAIWVSAISAGVVMCIGVARFVIYSSMRRDLDAINGHIGRGLQAAAQIDGRRYATQEELQAAVATAKAQHGKALESLED